DPAGGGYTGIGHIRNARASQPCTVTITCTSRTGTAMSIVVRAGGSAPPAPVDDDQEMSHSMLSDAVNVPPAIEEACRYSYEHGGVVSGNSASERTINPGPSQLTGVLSGSPGANTSRLGRAVAVTDSPGISACALTSVH